MIRLPVSGNADFPIIRYTIRNMQEHVVAFIEENFRTPDVNWTILWKVAKFLELAPTRVLQHIANSISAAFLTVFLLSQEEGFFLWSLLDEHPILRGTQFPSWLRGLSNNLLEDRLGFPMTSWNIECLLSFMWFEARSDLRAQHPVMESSRENILSQPPYLELQRSPTPDWSYIPVPSARTLADFWSLLEPVHIQDLPAGVPKCPVCKRAYYQPTSRRKNGESAIQLRCRHSHLIGRDCLARLIADDECPYCPCCLEDMFHFRVNARGGFDM